MRVFIIFSAIITLISCSTFDHEAILEQLRDHEERILKLETMCNQLNSNMEATQTILAALEQNDYITNVTKIMEGGVEVGYSLTFAKGGTITIYHGQSGEAAPAPKIGIRKASDGEYYWTSDDQWLTDENGDMIPASVPDDADGKYTTPLFRVTEGVWYVSFDNGNSWREFEGIIEDMTPEPLFKEVQDEEDHLCLILSDGTEIIIPKFKGSDVKKDMVCIIDGNNIYVRAKGFSPENDMVWNLNKVATGGNKYFNIYRMQTCPNETDNSRTTQELKLWKTSIDDLYPPNFNGTYIGGNHGFFCVDKITSALHGKSDADIGSIWTDSKGKTYVLTHIYNENQLGLVMFNEQNMSSGKMGVGNPEVGTEMTHQSGATNTGPISVEQREGTQLWQCFNKYSISIIIDGNERDIDIDLIESCNNVEITTQYNIIYVPAMLTYLMENAGQNDKDSQHSDEIEECYMTVYTCYSFNRNGSLSTYCSYHINKDIKLGHIDLVQSMAIGTDTYTYVPDTTFDEVTRHQSETKHTFTNDTWRDAEKVPYRYYQFADETCNKGMCLAYDRSIGIGQNDLRLAHCTNAGWFPTTRKMYPHLINGGTLSKGSYFDAMAARVPLYKYDEDLTAVGWYWCDDDIILMIDAHNAVDKEITLPDYMNDMRVEVLDKTESVTCNQTYLFNHKVRFTSDGYGYLILRLYH